MNRGFMRGPFLPIYGSGAIVMLLAAKPFWDNLWMVYVAGCIGATALEYVTGVVMEALFKVRYWDYSNKPFNFQGHICLGSTLAWGGLTVLMTQVIHLPVERFVLSMSGQVLTVITLILTAYICGDFALSFKAAMDLRNVLYRMEHIKREMLHIQKRLDVMIALTGENISGFMDEYEAKTAQLREELAEGVGARIEDIKAGVEERLERVWEPIARLKEVSNVPGADSVRKEWQRLKNRYGGLVDMRENISTVRDWIQGNMIRSNPTMYSTRFAEALEELKRRAAEKIDRDSDENDENE